MRAGSAAATSTRHTTHTTIETQAPLPWVGGRPTSQPASRAHYLASYGLSPHFYPRWECPSRCDCAPFHVRCNTVVELAHSVRLDRFRVKPFAPALLASGHRQPKECAAQPQPRHVHPPPPLPFGLFGEKFLQVPKKEARKNAGTVNSALADSTLNAAS